MSSQSSMSDDDDLPNLREHRVGLYDAPNGQLYFGMGRVCEVGYNSGGRDSTYFRVRPLLGYGREGRYQFRDIFEHQPMLQQYYTQPLPEGNKPKRFEPPTKELERDPKLGEEAFGLYITPDHMHYHGVGRVIAVCQGASPCNGTLIIHVQPIAGKTGDKYRFHDPTFQTYMHDDNLPSAPYPEGAGKKGKKTGAFPSLPPNPSLGEEDYGAYIAPNGQWYCGVGRVVRIGVNAVDTTHAYVEPIPGKRGGRYNFCHPITRDWMPDDQLPWARQDASTL